LSNHPSAIDIGININVTFNPGALFDGTISNQEKTSNEKSGITNLG
jgi:hypothetical protein